MWPAHCSCSPSRCGRVQASSDRGLTPSSARPISASQLTPSILNSQRYKFITLFTRCVRDSWMYCLVTYRFASFMVKLSSPHDMFVHLCFIFYSYVSSLTIFSIKISLLHMYIVIPDIDASRAGMLRMRISSNTFFIVKSRISYKNKCLEHSIFLCIYHNTAVLCTDGHDMVNFAK